MGKELRTKSKISNKQKTKNTNGKKIILVILAIFAVFFISNKIIESNISKSLVLFVEGLTSVNTQNASQYVTEDTVSFLSFEPIPENQELMSVFTKYLSVDIINVSKKSDEAIVRAKIKNKDFETILSKYMQKVVESNIQNTELKISEEELKGMIISYFKEQFDSSENAIIETKVDVRMIKKDGKWKIIVDDNFRDALFPGLRNITNSMGPQIHQ